MVDFLGVISGGLFLFEADISTITFDAAVKSVMLPLNVQFLQFC